MQELLNQYKNTYNLDFYDCDEEKFFIFSEEYKNFSYKNPGCDCNDQYCPHKLKINSLANMFLQSNLEQCFTVKKNIFQNIDLDSFEIKNTENIILEGAKQITNFYNRFMFPIKFVENGKISLYRDFLSIVEGFYFENESVDKIIAYFNGNKINIPLKGKYFLNSFPILLDSLFYNRIVFTFYKDGNIVNLENKDGKMIGGFLPQKLTNYRFLNDKIKYLDGSSKISPELLVSN